MKRKLWTLLLALGAALALCVGASATDFTGWTALMDAHSGQALADGNYYLNNDVTISQTITVSGTVTLDLNGHVLQYKNDNTKGSVIVIENGGQLTIQDSDPDAPHKFDPNSDGLWVLDEENGTKTVKGGVITGGTGTDLSTYGGTTWYCGGGALIKGLDRRLNEKTGIPFHIAEDPLRAIARGTGIALKNINRFSFLMK